MIEIWEVVNYEVVSKMLNLLYSQNLHSISPQFGLKSTPNYPIFTPIYPQKSPPFTQLRPARGLVNSQSDTLSLIKNIIKILQNSITYVNFVAECEKRAV